MCVKFDFKEIFDSELKKQLVQISIIAFIFLVVILIKPRINGTYIIDEKGNVVGIVQRGEHNFVEYDLIANVQKGSKRITQDVRLRKNIDENNRKEVPDSTHDIEAEMSTSLGIAVGKLEESRGKKIVLPSKLDDGSNVTWRKSDKSNRDWVIIPMLYVLICFAVIMNRQDKLRKAAVDERKQILKSLPRFTNQLLLMMNAGVILSDAFHKICYGYSMMQMDTQGELERNIIAMTESAELTNRSIPLLFSELAQKYSVKELMRISTVLRENEKRGSNIQDKLERESAFLWDNRKVIAKEQGKLIDTKMTYPLGLLLVLLIVITMAPAMMAM
nr:type II secretion system F family protein [uncultured Mogibacterium sp.]